MKIIPNIPLGIFDNFAYTPESITLDNDTAIFIYTDGITEAENNIKQLYSDNRLLELLNVNKSVKAQEIIDIAFNSVKEFANGAKQSDDITVLAFRYNSISSAMKCDITLQNEKSEIEKIAPFVDKICDKFGLPLSLNFNLNLVLEEALINIISYAYPNGEKGDIALSAKLIENKIMFEITDSGIEFDPTKVQKPNIELNSDERPIGGLGVFIIHQIMDQVQYQRIDGKNVLTLIKSIE
jgi:sigma-B regulation protein RsbU (phosphoserine phosphatase)